MRKPTCDCLAKAFHNRYANNPRYGEPKEIVFNRNDRVVVSLGEYGTVRLRSNSCPQCGNPYKEETV
jgi:hypothetical protein